MKLTPQAERVLRHLEIEGSISGVEAASIHKVRHLPRRIADLKEAGYPIRKEMRKDVIGQRYARYFLDTSNKEAA